MTRILLLILVAAAAEAHAWGGAPPREPNGATASLAWGTQDATVVTVPGFAFTPAVSETTWSWFDGLYLVDSGAMFAPLHVPSGALLVAMEFEACDFTAVGSAQVLLRRCSSGPAGSCVTLFSESTGGVETGGCGAYGGSLTSEVVNNEAYRYLLFMTTTSGDSDTRVRAARVWFRRQVSPAPESAAFEDVPVGHPLHPFVEALARAGVTAGCDESNFCPNDPITRGQMAVFLAKALGLHWAP